MNYTDDQLKQRDAVSDTPRTDADYALHGGSVCPEFARILERELAAVTAERNEANEKLHTMASPAVQGVLAKMSAPPMNQAMDDMRKNLEILDRVKSERDVLKADLCTFAVDMEKQLSASQQEAQRLRETLDAIMESAKVAYCATTDPMMTDALVGIGKRCKDAIEND